MIGVVLAALTVTWSGIGYPRAAQQPVPLILAQPPQTRGLRPPVQLRAVIGNTVVPAEWSVDPQGAAAVAGGAIAPPLQYRGYLRIRAAFGDQSATLPAFAYDSAAVDCYMGFPDGLRFDADGVANASGTPENSDIFQTGPANQPRDVFRGCTGAFIDGARYVLHVPYGGTVLHPQSGAYFGTVGVAQWRNDFTIAPVLRAGDILLFKTRDGRVVKMLDYEPTAGVLSAAYLVGPHRGDFADYLAFSHTKTRYVPHALFGNHHR